jgi:pantoate kinase
MKIDKQKACKDLSEFQKNPDNNRYLQESNIFDKYISLVQRCYKS